MAPAEDTRKSPVHAPACAGHLPPRQRRRASRPGHGPQLLRLDLLRRFAQDASGDQDPLSGASQRRAAAAARPAKQRCGCSTR
eukprot:5706889-Pyramimonas_sp.AAC.1